MLRHVLLSGRTWPRLIPRARVQARAALAAMMVSAISLTLVTGVPETARAAESADGLTYIILSPGASEARYIMQVRSLGQPPKPAMCTTRDISGQIVLSPEGGVIAELSQLNVDQRSLRCAAPLRDDMAQKTLQTAQHPVSTFMAQSAPGLAGPLVVGEQSYQLIGDQIVRGVTRSVAYESSGTFTNETFEGSSRTVLKMSDFGIAAPNLGPLLSVSDEMVAEIDIRAATSAPPAPAAP